MKYVFFGNTRFAAIVLEKLIQYKLFPALLICRPDKPAGRKLAISQCSTKKVALEYNIPILQPEILTFGLMSKLKEYRANFFLIVAYHKILAEEILSIPAYGSLGLHPSLLPKYRGPSPIRSAILYGEKEFGVSLFLVDQEIDHGPIIKQAKIKMENAKYLELEEKLAELGANLIINVVPDYLEGKVKPVPQPETLSYTKKFTTADGYVDLEKQPPVLIERKIRALNPNPGVFTFLTVSQIQEILGYAIRGLPNQIKRVKLLEAKLENNKLRLLKIQVEGKKPAVVDKIIE